MNLLDFFGVIILGLVLGAQIFKRSLFSWILKWAWIFSIILFFGFDIYEIITQYLFWLHRPLTKFLLPPYQSINYFLIYAVPRILVPTLIALVAAIIAREGARFLNSRGKELFFEKEEPMIFGLAVFLVGYPGFFIYLIILALIFLAFNLFFTLYHLIFLKSKAPKLSLYFFWLIVAIFAIIIKKWIIPANYLIFFNI